MSRRKRSTQFSESAKLNNWAYWMYFNKLYEIGMSRFKWDNLPPTVDERYLEMTLFNQGCAVYFNDDIIGNLALSVINSGGFDVYGNPAVRRAYSAYNNYQKMVHYNNSVMVYNNYTRTPCRQDITVYANRLWVYDRIIDVNVNAQKTPILILGTDKQQLSLRNLYKEYDGNQPVIFGDSSLNVESLKVLKTDAPFLADKIYALKQSIWNEALTYLGVENVVMEKKERMIDAEVESQKGGTTASRFSPLGVRQIAAEKINRMFGTNVEVSYRNDWMKGELDVPMGGDVKPINEKNETGGE